MRRRRERKIAEAAAAAVTDVTSAETARMPIEPPVEWRTEQVAEQLPASDAPDAPDVPWTVRLACGHEQGPLPDWSWEGPKPGRGALWWCRTCDDVQMTVDAQP